VLIRLLALAVARESQSSHDSQFATLELADTQDVGRRARRLGRELAFEVGGVARPQSFYVRVYQSFLRSVFSAGGLWGLVAPSFVGLPF